MTNEDNSSTSSILSAASDQPSTIKLPPLQFRLERSNYSLWRHCIRSALIAFALEVFLVPGNVPPELLPIDPANPTAARLPNPEHAEWLKKDRLILLWLQSTISTPLLAHIVRAPTTADAWTILEQMFHAQTRANQMHLKHQLHTFPKGSLSILDYVEKKRSFSDSLAECSCIVPDDEFVECVLHGLDSSYSAFRTAFNMRLGTITSHQLLGLLLEEEARINEQQGASPSPQPTFSANYTNRSSPTSNSAPTDASSKPRPTCQICRKLGHEAINCWQRLNVDQYPATKARPPRSGSSNHGNRNRQSLGSRQAYSVSAPPMQASPSTLTDPAWYFDTGASNHVTAEMGNLAIQSEYNGNDGLQVGNGFAGQDTTPRNR